jgi:WD repeat-containing protein 23
VLASQDDEAEDEGETTLYFDAQEGTFVNEDGEEITVDVEEEEDEELDDEDEDEDEDEEAEGGETPAAANEASTGGARTVRGTSMLLY